MNIEEAEVKLYIRKYQWAIINLAHEIEEGCPYLRTLSDLSSQKFLLYLEQFPATEQLELATLILKNCYRPAMQLFGEALTQGDEAKIKKYQIEVRSISLPAVSPIPITKTFAVKRADTAKIVLSTLSAALDSKPSKLFSLNWFYTTLVGDWEFRTELDFGGTWGTEVRCLHRLVRNDNKNWGLLLMTLQTVAGPIRVPQNFPLLSLYGLPTGVYPVQSIQDVQIAAQTISDTYSRLLEAASGWVNDLTLD